MTVYSGSFPFSHTHGLNLVLNCERARPDSIMNQSVTYKAHSFALHRVDLLSVSTIPPASLSNHNKLSTQNYSLLRCPIQSVLRLCATQALSSLHFNNVNTKPLPRHHLCHCQVYSKRSVRSPFHYSIQLPPAIHIQLHIPDTKSNFTNTASISTQKPSTH